MKIVEIRRRESMTFKSISAIKRFGSHETSPSDIWENLQSKFSGFYLRSRIFIPLPFEASLRFNLTAMIWAFSLPTFCVIASARKWRVVSCTKLTCIFIISPGANKLAFPTFINESVTIQRVEGEKDSLSTWFVSEKIIVHVIPPKLQVPTIKWLTGLVLLKLKSTTGKKMKLPKES